jgi:hypothetical protein
MGLKKKAKFFGLQEEKERAHFTYHYGVRP